MVHPDNEDQLEPTVVKLPRRLTLAELPNVLGALEPVLRCPAESNHDLLDVDLGDVEFCTPAGITSLAAAIESASLQKKFLHGKIHLPRNQDVLRYLQRMNFFDEIGIDAPEDFDRRTPDGFRPVTHIVDDSISPRIVREMAAAIQECHPNIDGGAMESLKTFMNELVENVFYHAASAIDCLICVQAYRRKSTVELAIADAGRGIRPCMLDSSKFGGQITDDFSAIELAIQQNVSALPDPRRGIGLWLATELVRRNEGTMTILSNDGGLKIDRLGAHREDGMIWPGTFIAVEFRLDRPINTNDVYESGGFPGIDEYDEIDF